MKQTDIMFRTMVVTIIAIAMIGMTGLGAATYTSVQLDNKDSNWALTPNDCIGATINYDSSGDEFVWGASGTAVSGVTYSLIYYADKPDRFNNWGGDNPGAMIGTITTDSSGVITGSGSIDLGMDLPRSPDANIDLYDYCVSDDYANCHGAKLWMVPSHLLSGYPGPGAWIAGYSWSAACQPYILFETDLITYTDCDLYETSPPANATFTIEDALVGEPMNITITNATNVGAVKVVLTYNASAVTLLNVVNGDMETTVPNIVAGQVTIGTYQGTNDGLNGDFTLGGLNFTPIGNGTYDFSLYVVTYKDATPCGRTMPFDFAGTYGQSYLNGDVNNDSVVDMFDVMYLAKYVIGITGFEDIIELASDVDGDGDIDMADVTYLAMHIVGASGWEVLL